MLPLIARGLRHGASPGGRALQQALQLQQKRYLNIHEYQGAQLMAKYGINVPDGVPAHTVDEVKRAAEEMKDEKGEVRRAWKGVAGCGRGRSRTGE
jgi:succinyl-CoA synthetase beta subunit